MGKPMSPSRSPVGGIVSANQGIHISVRLGVLALLRLVP